MQHTITLPAGLIPIGTKVYLPRPAVGKVAEDSILGYYGCLSGAPTLTFTVSDYRLNTANLESFEGHMLDRWKPDEFFLSYDEALVAARRYPLHVTDADAYTAIGYEPTEDGYDLNPAEAELQDCCATVDAIRAVLGRAIHQSTMSGVYRERLKKLLEQHTAPNTKTMLTSILEQLDLKW